MLMALTFIFILVRIADADRYVDTDPELTQDEGGGALDRDLAAGNYGAMRVDRDLYPYHYDDANQFGDDEAYNSTGGHAGKRVPFPIHREDN